MDRTLQQFLAIAEAGSITAAARVLNVTQPTLTVNMQRLEKELGLPLLRRTAEGVRLTSYGESLRENVRLMQRIYDNALISLKEQRERDQEGIALACGDTWWTLFIHGVVKAYRIEHPTAPVRVNVGDQIQCMEQLLSGDISVFVSFRFDGLRATTGARFIPLSQSPPGYFVRPGHPLLEAPRSRGEIFAYPRAIPATPENRYRAFINEAERLETIANAFVASRFAFASNSLTACLDYVRDSDAVLHFTQLLTREIGKRGLVEVTQGETPVSKTMGIYLLADRAGDPKIAHLVDRITLAAASALPPLAQGTNPA
ncbi:MAG: LysR family transcriptional regulator [Devosia sp.]